MKDWKKSLLILLIVITGIAFDQTTKALAVSTLQGNSGYSFLWDTIRLRYAENTGGFLSLGSNLPEAVKFWIMRIIPLAALSAMLVFTFIFPGLSRLEVWMMSLLLSGGISNLVDRFFNQGRVIDFLNIGIGPVRTGILNVADILITVGAIGLVLLSIVRRPKRASSPPGRQIQLNDGVKMKLRAIPSCEAIEQVLTGGRQLIETGLVAGTWGNVSIRIDANTMAITPSGGAYEQLTAEDIAIVNLIDGTWTGARKPSSEKGLHVAIYQSRPEINAVLHTHSMNASTVAAARREVPPILDDLAQIVGPSVRVADYALPSTKKLVRATMKALRGRNAALLANHGAVCLGRDLEEALTCCQVLEKGCKAFIEAEFLGGAKSINKFEAALMHQIYLKKYSKLKR